MAWFDPQIPNTTGLDPQAGITIALCRRPASLQSKNRDKRDEQRDLIKQHTQKIKYLYTDDVSVLIEWELHERERYESNQSADLDNIIKLILDALCGRDGILIDDCQVKSITASWTDWAVGENHVSITVEPLAKCWIPKDDLVFIDLGDKTCLPFNKDDVEPRRNELEEAIRNRAERRASTGDDYYAGREQMPKQRVFHRSRIGDFEIVRLA